MPCPNHICELEDDHRQALEIAIENARNGPNAYRVRGSKPNPQWVPPEHVHFDHPEHGPVRVHVATGNLEPREE